MKLIHTTLCVIGVGVLGCEHSNAVGTTTTTSAVTIGNDTAIENVAYGRCTHAYTCNNVGEGREWDSLASCTTEQRGAANAAIGHEICARGIDANALQGCMSAIDRAPCAVAALPDECLKSRLCL